MSIVAMKDRAFGQIRCLALIKTQAEHLLDAMHNGTVSTNVFLRRIHNFALDMNWLPCSIIPKRQWPVVQFKEKRANVELSFMGTTGTNYELDWSASLSPPSWVSLLEWPRRQPTRLKL